MQKNWYQEQQDRLADIMERGDTAFKAILNGRTVAEWFADHIRSQNKR